MFTFCQKHTLLNTVISFSRLINFLHTSFGLSNVVLLLLCSHSHNDVPHEPQRNVSVAAMRGAVRLSVSNVVFVLSVL